ncbi:LytR/AlgR family response regulator transcription factor [Flavobacterium sp.]|uniref:LytR/AlgR family response regulator transcription factor n=1 Tax=Flavobacterium sp. TaxID=239 RepID=UPI0039E3018A
MIRVVIIEDEAGASQYLESTLAEVAPDLRVIHKTDNMAHAAEWFSGNEADLIFLDIKTDDENVFSLFEQMGLHTPVIFTTTCSHHAVRAFRFNSIDYLLKPFSGEELGRAIGKFRSNPMRGIDVGGRLDNLQQKKGFQERFLAVSGKKMKSIPVQQVAYFMTQGRYTQLVTKTNEKYLIDHSLENIINRVDPKLFFRINRQMIVGFDAIVHMIAWSRSRIKIELSPPAEVEVVSSIDNTAEFRKWLDR